MKILELKMKVSFERSKMYLINDKLKVNDFVKETSMFKAQALKALKKEFGDEITNVNITYEFEEKT